MERVMKGVKRLLGEVDIAGDKSVSHRAIMTNAIADGDAKITNFLSGEDCISTLNIFRSLGVDISVFGKEVIVRGRGMRGLRAFNGVLNAGNSGTTTRLLSGILAPQSFESAIDGDDSLRLRPMKRVIEPLSLMGARIEASGGNFLPLKIYGRRLHGIEYDKPMASAQVKSAIIYASLYADSESVIAEKVKSRDHTEIMLKSMGADIEEKDNVITVRPIEKLVARDVRVPGDISSAAYFLVAGAIAPNSEITVKNVGLNPTRAGIISVMRRMGADISVEEYASGGERAGDITVRSSELSGTVICGDEIPTLIDELPIIAVLACMAKGVTVVKDAAELKVKETDRIDTVYRMITALGGKIEKTDDGFIIEGTGELSGARVESFKDHRIAMSAAVASLVASGETVIADAECVDISFPEFYNILGGLHE